MDRFSQRREIINFRSNVIYQYVSTQVVSPLCHCDTGADHSRLTNGVRTTVEATRWRPSGEVHRVTSTRWAMLRIVTTARRWIAAPGTRRGHRDAQRRC
ncbi:hypothetical protein ABZ400_34735 [Streptomyces sp. NPDC005897]|uniref:hypothetical protein n=1 Tax=Streptomyces sp. NPDC005897 TaxID=3157081 RepID=UPI0033C30CF4